MISFFSISTALSPSNINPFETEEFVKINIIDDEDDENNKKSEKKVYPSDPYFKATRKPHKLQ